MAERRFLTPFIWVAILLQIGLMAGRLLLEGLALAAQGNLGLFAESTIRGLSELMFPAVGLLIFLRRPAHPIGWLFAVANLGWGVNNFAAVYARHGLQIQPGSLPGAEWAPGFYSWPGIISLSLYTALILLFPNGRLPGPRWKVLGWVVAVWTPLAVLAILFAPMPVDDTIGFEVDNPFGLEGPFGTLFVTVAQLSFPGSFVLFLTAWLALLLRFRKSDTTERLQLKWLTMGIGIIALFLVAQLLVYGLYGSFLAMPGWARLVHLAAIISIGLIPVTAAIAILRYRLYEIDFIIRKTLVYSLLTAILAAIYFGGVVLAQQFFRAVTGQTSNLAVVLSTLLIAALFTPLRRRLQAIIDRHFYRRKYDADQTLARFNQSLRNEVDLEALQFQLVGVVQDTMQPATIALWLKDG